jgi:uncharacterized alkaline shock family protein YloU
MDKNAPESQDKKEIEELEAVHTLVTSQPETAGLTYDGVEYIVSGISHAFGRDSFRGIDIDKEGDSATVEISIALYEGYPVYETAARIQKLVADLMREKENLSQCFVNVDVTRIVAKEVNNG